MPTVLFDFDSTLIPCESLEEILRPRLAGRPDDLRRIGEITAAGMEGGIPFAESLRRRLAIAAPTRDEVARFGERARGLLTRGMDRLVAGLHGRGVEVRIVSSAFVEAILPAARGLGIRESRVHGMRARWDGGAAALADDDPFTRSKVEGVRDAAESWPRPRVAVGDGATDHALLEGGAADRFVAFTQHARRASVLAKGAPEARDVADLARILDRLLDGSP